MVDFLIWLVVCILMGASALAWVHFFLRILTNCFCIK